MANLLPAGITLDIVSRLPVETVLECKLVCKNWRSLILDAFFADMHLRRQLLQFDDSNYYNHSNVFVAAKVGFVFSRLEREDERLTYQLYCGEYEENYDPDSFKTLRRINHPFFYDADSVVGSCNGLICLRVPDHDQYRIPSQVYVCNPITREYVILPTLKEEGSIKYPIVHGFGYNPSTNEYKVVRIYYCAYSVGCIQVYTLGSGTGWRNKGEITYKFDTLQYSPAIFANGALHWLDTEGKILAKFRILPSPPCSPPCSRPLDEDYSGIRLRILGGWLCFVLYKFGKAIDIWSLEKTKKNRSHDNMKEHEYYYHSWNWSLKFRIEELVHFQEKYDPFALTKNGELLLLYDGHNLCRYKPKTATLEELNKDSPYYYGQLPYMKSFVSLKALGEADTRIIEPGGLVKEY